MPGIKTYFSRVAKSTSNPRREVPIDSTPTTTRTIRTPVTTGSKLRNNPSPVTTAAKLRNYATPKTTRSSQNPASTGRMRNYTKPTLIYRPLELDTESSSESSDGLLRQRKDSARPVEPALLCLPAPKNLSQQTQVHQPQMKQPAEPWTPKRKQSPPDEEDDDEIQIIEVVTKRSDLVKTPNPAKRRKSHHRNHPHHDLNSDLPEESAPKVIDEKPIEIVQVSQCMTPPITPERSAKEDKAEKEMVPECKLPTFIPGNCDIEEIMRFYGVRKNPDPGAAEMSKKSEAV